MLRQVMDEKKSEVKKPAEEKIQIIDADKIIRTLHGFLSQPEELKDMFMYLSEHESNFLNQHKTMLEVLHNEDREVHNHLRVIEISELISSMSTVLEKNKFNEYALKIKLKLEGIIQILIKLDAHKIDSTPSTMLRTLPKTEQTGKVDIAYMTQLCNIEYVGEKEFIFLNDEIRKHAESFIHLTKTNPEAFAMLTHLQERVVVGINKFSQHKSSCPDEFKVIEQAIAILRNINDKLITILTASKKVEHKLISSTAMLQSSLGMTASKPSSGDRKEAAVTHPSALAAVKTDESEEEDLNLAIEMSLRR